VPKLVNELDNKLANKLDNMSADNKRCCLQPAQKLRSPTQFQRCFSSRKRWVSAFWSAHYEQHEKAVDTSFLPARLGVVIAKRQVKSSVSRNLLKRQARQQFRVRQHQLQGFDVVLRFTQSATLLHTAQMKVISADLEKMLGKLIRSMSTLNNKAVSASDPTINVIPENLSEPKGSAMKAAVTLDANQQS
jgi:ribonuclease P protein component